MTDQRAIAMQHAMVNLCGKWFEVAPIVVPWATLQLGMPFSPYISGSADVDETIFDELRCRLNDGKPLDTQYRHTTGNTYDIRAYVRSVERNLSRDHDGRYWMRFDLVCAPLGDFVEQIGSGDD